MTRYEFSTAVNGHQYAQACVNHFSDGTIELQSYTTTVISVTPEGWLSCSGTYSATTRKHIGWFMRQLCREHNLSGLDYYTAKKLYADDMIMNIYTGEVKSIYSRT